MLGDCAAGIVWVVNVRQARACVDVDYQMATLLSSSLATSSSASLLDA
jgi:hypothetical protein